MPTPQDRRWYLVIAAPQMDVRMASDLGRRGYETHVAMSFTREGTGNRAWVQPKLKLSPYVWVCVNYTLGQDLDGIKNTFGFVDAVRLSLRGDLMNWSEIPEAVIRGMRQDMIEDYEMVTRRVRRKESPFSDGQRVRIRQDHVCGGLEGIVTSSRPGSLMVELGPNRVPWRFKEDDVALVESFRGKAA